MEFKFSKSSILHIELYIRRHPFKEYPNIFLRERFLPYHLAKITKNGNLKIFKILHNQGLKKNEKDGAVFLLI